MLIFRMREVAIGKTEGRRKKEEGRRKKEEGRKSIILIVDDFSRILIITIIVKYQASNPKSQIYNLKSKIG